MENSVDNNFINQLQKLIPTAGKLKLSKNEKIALYEEIKDEEIQIKTDGTVFAPWTAYANRLNAAVTGVGWSMIPQGNPEERADGFIYWGFHLIIRGCYCGFAYGAVQKSDLMNWNNAIEGAKSNALMRLCKEIGIGLKLWDKKFIQEWQAKNAYQDGQQKWRMGPKPEKEEIRAPEPPKEVAAPSTDHESTIFKQLNERNKKRTEALEGLDARLTPIVIMGELTKEWENLGPDIQSDERIFAVFKTHIKRVRAIPKKLEVIYGVSQEEQERAIGDLLAVLRKYSTSAEVIVNLDTHIKEFIAQGMFKEHEEIARMRIDKLILHKKETNLKTTAA